MFQQWDVVVVPFPFIERKSKKRRPALVVSAPSLHKSYGLYWLVMITSAKNSPWDCDVAIKSPAKAGLKSESVVRTAKLTVVQEDMILHAIGTLDTPERKKVSHLLSTFLAD